MRLRSKLAKVALRARPAIELMLPCLLSAECLQELSLSHFAAEASRWQRNAGEGLFEGEEAILRALELESGRALCLGSGGGREAFALARRGFETVGVEQIEALVRFSREYAATHGLKADFVAGTMTELDPAAAPFDLILASNTAYSYIPSRRRRIALLARCRRLLVPEGRCVVSFVRRTPSRAELRWRLPLKAIARLAGNPHRQTGDRVVDPGHFVHFFKTSDEVEEEGYAAGFSSCELFQEDGLYAVFAP